MLIVLHINCIFDSFFNLIMLIHILWLNRVHVCNEVLNVSLCEIHRRLQHIMKCFVKLVDQFLVYNDVFQLDVSNYRLCGISQTWITR